MAKAKKKKYARPGDLRQHDKNRDQNQNRYDQRKIILKEGSGRDEKVVRKALEALRAKGSDILRKIGKIERKRRRGRRPITRDPARFFEDTEEFFEREISSPIERVKAPRVKRIK